MRSARRAPSTAAATAAWSAANTTRSPLLGARALDERALLGLGEELDDGAAQRAPLLDVDVGHALGAVRLGHLGELVDLGAREGGGAGRAQRAHHAAALERAAKDLETALGEDVAEVGDLEAEAQVGLVGAVAQHGLVVGEHRQRQRRAPPPQPRSRSPP